MTIIFWEDNGIKMWELVNKDDFEYFFMALLSDTRIDRHKIFLISTCSVMDAMWAQKDTHVSSRVNFSRFFEEYGTTYRKPNITKEMVKVIDEIHDKKDIESKLGWVSPSGQFFNCDYGGHIRLADKICFGHANTSNSERYLEDSGWCKISRSLSDNDFRIYMGDNYTLSKDQFKKIKELGLEQTKGIDAIL